LCERCGKNEVFSRLFSENASKKSLHDASEPIVYHKKDHKGQYKQSEEADENFQDFENQPQRDESGKENKEWIFQ
jgi:hypothetical protein